MRALLALTVIASLSACGTSEPGSDSPSDQGPPSTGVETTASGQPNKSSFPIFTKEEWDADQDTYKASMIALRNYARYPVRSSDNSYVWDRMAYFKYWRNSIQHLSLQAKREKVQAEMQALGLAANSIANFESKYWGYYYIQGDQSLRELDESSKTVLTNQKRLLNQTKQLLDRFRHSMRSQ